MHVAQDQGRLYRVRFFDALGYVVRFVDLISEWLERRSYEIQVELDVVNRENDGARLPAGGCIGCRCRRLHFYRMKLRRQIAFDLSDEGLRINRFGNIAVETACDELLLVADHRQGRDCDERRLRTATGFETPRKLIAVDAGHQYVA